jgi:hypothetical protein
VTSCLLQLFLILHCYLIKATFMVQPRGVVRHAIAVIHNPTLCLTRNMSRDTTNGNKSKPEVA